MGHHTRAAPGDRRVPVPRPSRGARGSGVLSSAVVVGLDWLPSHLVLDGGVGTALIARGLDLGEEPPEAWNLGHPDAIKQVHRQFAEAGAGAVQTNTFGANRLRLCSSGREDQVAALNRAGVQLAREAVPRGVLVIGSMGPTGTVPPPEGDADLVELEETFADQAAALADEQVDLLHVETFYHPKELRAALRGCRAGAAGVPVVASFSCGRVGSGYASVLGFPPDALLSVALEEGAEGVGVNCTLIPADMLALVERLVARAQVPVFAKPVVAPHQGAPLYPQEFAAGALALFGAGARAVGGCCGTGPADVAALKNTLDAAPRRMP